MSIDDKLEVIYLGIKHINDTLALMVSTDRCEALRVKADIERHNNTKRIDWVSKALYTGVIGGIIVLLFRYLPVI